MDRRQFTISAAGVFASTQFVDGQEQGDSPNKQLSVAVIGHTGRGNFGHGLDKVWNLLDDTTIVAVADADSAGLKSATSRLKLEPTAGFTDYRRMLTEVRPDIVAVCPRHIDQHHDMILAAIEAGARGIYAEKPFVRTPAEADRVVAECSRNSVKLAVAHRNRYHPALAQISISIKQGRIGRLLEIRARGKGDRRGGGEDLWVLGSHVMNLIHFFGGEPTTCSATLLQDGKRVKPSDVRDGAEGLGLLAGNEVHARFELDHGLIAYFDSIANDGTNGAGFGLSLVGSEGIIMIQCDKEPLAHLIPGNPFEPAGSPTRWLPITTGGIDVPEPQSKQLEQVSNHVIPAADLVAAVREDRQPLCDVHQAATTIEMISAVFASHCHESQAVNIPLKSRQHPLALYQSNQPPNQDTES